MYLRKKTTFITFKYKNSVFCIICQKLWVLLAQSNILTMYPEKFPS